MSSLFGLAEEYLSKAASGSSDSEGRKAGKHEHNTSHRPEGGFDTSEVLSHANDVDEEGKGYIKNAMKHVHENHKQRDEDLDASDLSKYGPMILAAIASVTAKSGFDISTLTSGRMGDGGGNQLMAMVMKEAGKAFGGGGREEKQSMMNGAAMTLTKLMARKQLAAFTGSGGSGGMLDIGKTLLKSRFG